uniref:RING-type domain-containing protein n=1 Tax=Pyramimonas orientalis virus TaxID=455367 RepID=A0A7M3UNS5_POV01|nr:hypothetical protein HWQ62_00219 [Pyramimonas orientalis virus]
MSDECTVCCSKYNKVIRKKIDCFNCDYSACRHCIENYTKSKYDDFHCMSCKKPWEYDFFLKNMTQACVKRIMEHRADILFEREKAKMPDTQVYVSYVKELEKDKKLLRSMFERFTQLDRIVIQDEQLIEKLFMSMGKNDKSKAQITDELDELNKQTKLLSEKKTDLLKKVEFYRRKIFLWDDDLRMLDDKNEPEANKLSVIRKCTENDCRGFVMSDWACGICEKKYCKKCHETEETTDDDEQHKCNPDDIKTIELIMKTTKPCPTCATLIHKINGCSQMWCPSCKTAFNYTTGTIETGIIHNPHYFEWFRKNKENNAKIDPTQTNCNREVNQRQLLTHANVAFSSNAVTYRKIHINCRLYGHLSHVMRNIQDIDTMCIRYNLKHRIEWMLGNMDDTDFKKILQKEEKTCKYNANVKHICAMTRTVFNDIFHKILYKNTPEEIEPFLEECNEIIKYADEHLKDVAITYGYKPKTIETM